MKYTEILAVEYQEQYNQYRWIGTMQSVILTFYGAVASFSLFLASKFISKPPSLTDLVWPSRVLVFVGFLGVIVAIGLIKSRAMQARTARYLAAILTEMASLSENLDLPTTTALRYRGLCSSGGRFVFLDTGNIATYLSFVFGLLLAGVGLLMAIAIEIELEPDFRLLWIYLPILLLLVLALPKWILECMRKAEQAAVERDFRRLKASRGLEEGMRIFGINESDRRNSDNSK